MRMSSDLGFLVNVTDFAFVETIAERRWIVETLLTFNDVMNLEKNFMLTLCDIHLGNFVLVNCFC